jgi:small-conductance mechanosensitive channel
MNLSQLSNLSHTLHTIIGDKLLFKLGITALALLCLWVANRIVSMTITRHVQNDENRYATRKIVRYSLFVVGLFIIGQIWFQGIQSLGTFLGLFTAGLAIALKDVVTNFAGWLYLLWQQPFKIGDRIQIQDQQGDVIDIGVFKFTLLEIGNWVDANQSTGRMIRIPNADIFNQPIANYSKGFNYIWYEIPIVLTFESNWKKAKDLFLEVVTNHYTPTEEHLKKALKQAKSEYPINYTYTTPTIYTNTVAYGISLTLRYMVSTRKIRQSSHDIWESLLDIMDNHHDIHLAYPTERRIVDGIGPEHVKR